MGDNSFSQIFEIELKCWCYGISHTTEKIDHRVLHQVIKSFAPVLREAVEHHYSFDILDTAKQLSKSGKCKSLEEKEVTFHLLSNLPTPADLSKEQIEVLMEIVQKVEDVYGGAFSRLEKKWKAVNRSDFSEMSNCSLPQLNMPAVEKFLKERQ